MSKLEWDVTGTKEYETGVSKGVLYPQVESAYPVGVAWSGLTAVNESPSGAEANKLYADDVIYAILRSAEEYGGTIEAYMYPDEFAACDGSSEPVTGLKINQQKRQAFGFSFVTQKSTDADPDAGYVIHLVYGATATPSERSHATVNDSPEAVTLSWTFETTPVSVTGYRPTANLEIDSTKFTASTVANLHALEDKLYGTASTAAYLPLPDEVISTISGNDTTTST